ncbi:hypothetical protein HOLleu_26961 [Holothuria leucospilota]|uniref:Uncharacterized protein n=1 Tax=Holothuria leucospilota TaxID=206669 RepID=A0A9Q1BQ38_HOLLE|nr:hypothetical protein HOLleu_26961 [Holothuria leucospilota]
MLREAAIRKKDENILIHIRDKDCVALEVRGDRQDEYQQAYEMFCNAVVQQRLINNQEIMRMSKLTQLFVKMIHIHEGIDLVSYRPDKLKYRLRRDYPELCFHQPFRKNQCEIVYTDSLSAGSLAESLQPTDESSTASSDVESEEYMCTYDVSGQYSMRTLYNAGLIIRNAVKDAPSMTGPWPPTSDDLSLESAKELVPAKLFNLMAWCTGATEEPSLTAYVEVSDEHYVRLMSLCQDIIYLASKGKKQTPKSLCLGLTVRHLTGSSQLLSLLNKFGHCSSWDTVIGLETSLAQLQLATSHLVPKGFAVKTPTVLVWDNIDFGEETVSGHGTTHHTNGIMIQSHITKQAQSQRIETKKGIRSLTPIITELDRFTSVKRVGPQCNCDVTLLNKSQFEMVITPALRSDFLFLLSKHLWDNGGLPSWTGYNIKFQGKETLQKSAIHYLPVVEAPPTEMTTINTILQRSISIADKLHLEHIVLVFDQAIYAKIQEIRWAREGLMQRTVVRLGEFHICMSYMGIIGKRFSDAGLRDILIESGVVAQGSINSVLSGHHYNRAVHSYKLMFEAMEKLRFTVFLDNLTEEQVERYSCVLQEPTSIQQLLAIKFQDVSDLMACYDAFVKKRNQESPTFALWSSFIDMVQLLLVFLRATRDSDWNLHLAAIRLMIPWFFAYDRMNYSRYLPAYWLEMVNLQATHPKCYEELSKRGEWTVQRQDRYSFSSIACDQAIEQTCNRDCKTRGGITLFTLNPGAVQRWILSQPERSAIARQCEVMCGIDEHKRKPKELDHTRIQRDNEAIASIMSTVTSMINPFDHFTEQMVCLSSGAVASDAVKADMMNALEEGEADSVAYMKNRLIANKVDMFSPIKQKKLKTFTENYNNIKKFSKDVVIKQHRKFFARLLIVSQKRRVNLREVFSYSLGSISFPLASASGSLAKTNKAALLHAIEENAVNCVVSEVPSNAAMVVDGMAHVQSMQVIPDTFGELAEAVLSQICGLAVTNKCSRVDFVTDRYDSVSIKNFERSRRAQSGSQMFKIYSGDQKTPRQFKKFLSLGINKEALIEFLFSAWRETRVNLQHLTVFSTSGDHCQCLQLKEGMLEITPCHELFCDHEEADTRLLLHARHAAETTSNIIISSPDTDVAVIALSLLDNFPSATYFMTGAPY